MDGWVRTWRVSLKDDGEECGSAFAEPGKCRVPAGAPLVAWRHVSWSSSVLSRIRCLAHAPKEWPVDHDAIAAAREQYDAKKRAAAEADAAAAADRERRGMTPPAPPAQRPRQVQKRTGFSKLAECAGAVFDHKSAAANDRD